MTIFASSLDLWSDDSFTSNIFLGIGFVGLLLIIFQAIFGVFLGHDGNTDAGGSIDLHGGHGGGSSVVSIKTVSAMLLGFGFGGAVLEKSGFGAGLSALGGIGVGFVLGAGYFFLMHSLYKLRSDGTAVLKEALNRSGTVYMRIPSGLSGSGEIQISFGGRSQNIRAFTRGMELPSGTPIRVIALHGDTALLVEKLS